MPPLSKKQTAARNSDKENNASITQASSGPDASSPQASVLSLQRAAGNRATSQLLQAELTISSAADECEREADQTAREIMGGASTPGKSRLHGSDNAVLRRTDMSGSGGAEAPGSVHEALGSSGQPLDPATRSFMESRFEADFSGVRIHTDSRAERSALEINAEAYTVGQDIVFGTGRYAPTTATGGELLAHELAHVVQQGSGGHMSGGVRRKTSDTGSAPAASPEALPPGFADELNYDRIAKDVHEAIAGLGTDEEGVYLALQRLKRDPEAIARLKSTYRTKYGDTLEDDIRGDFSGTELEYALQLINMGTPGSAQAIGKTPSTEEEWKAAARRLRDAVEGLGTDEEAIYSILLPLKRDQNLVAELKKTYAKEYNEDLRERLLDELSGSEEDYALYLLGERRVELAKEDARDILDYIRSEARKKAKTPQTIDPSSNFYKQLKDKYLKDYLANPTEIEGKKAVEKIGRPGEGRRKPTGEIEIKPEGGAWRPAENSWEQGIVVFWNKQKLPELPPDLRDLPLFKDIKALPTELGAGTDVLIKENVANLPYLDVPFLIGRPNPGTSDFWIDVKNGGKNISQLMHWATGVKYSDQSPRALRDLFIAYELWHLEGWDIFGQDPINDLIAEEQGRILGSELRKGGSGAIKSEADLIPFLNQAFLEARAWVGALLRMRQTQLDDWILSEKQPLATIHWNPEEQFKLWPDETVTQMIESGKKLEEFKTSYMVTSQIEIYTLIYEADEWEKKNGAIGVTPLQKALVEGKLNALLKIMAKSEENVPINSSEKLDAYSNLQDLKKMK